MQRKPLRLMDMPNLYVIALSGTSASVASGGGRSVPRARQAADACASPRQHVRQIPRYENADICDRCHYSKVSNTFERCHGPELPDDPGRCPDLPGAGKRYPGHEVLSRRSHHEATVEATGSQCKRGGIQTVCETI